MHALVCRRQSIAAGKVVYLYIMTVYIVFLCEKYFREVLQGNKHLN